MQYKRLIVNADDFGESPEVNDGIVEAHLRGIVTSTSLLTNMPGFEHALARLRDTPSLDVGVHLNAHRGAPLTECSYLARGGKFLHRPALFALRCYLDKRRAREEITREFEAQIQKAVDAGITITHLDTEKHLHTLPFIFEIVLTLAEKHNIPSVRFPFERIAFSTLGNLSQFYKVAAMALCAPLNKHLLRKSTRKSPRHLYGVSLSKRFSTSSVVAVLKMLEPGVSELSCHPGYPPKSATNYIDAYREQELEVLTNPALKANVRESGVVLSTFSDIR